MSSGDSSQDQEVETSYLFIFIQSPVGSEQTNHAQGGGCRAARGSLTTCCANLALLHGFAALFQDGVQHARAGRGGALTPVSYRDPSPNPGPSYCSQGPSLGNSKVKARPLHPAVYTLCILLPLFLLSGACSRPRWLSVLGWTAYHRSSSLTPAVCPGTTHHSRAPDPHLCDRDEAVSGLAPLDSGG